LSEAFSPDVASAKSGLEGGLTEASVCSVGASAWRPGIATVTTVRFCGFPVGPAVIGLTSKFFGLSVALGVVVLLALIAAVCGPAIIRWHAASRVYG
jgi:hypothetical protein